MNFEKTRINFLTNPIGIDDKTPVFSWQIVSDKRGWNQTAYQILVATAPELLTEQMADQWNSEMVQSSQSNNIPYMGRALSEKTRYYWIVRVWDNLGNVSPWSEIAFFETAIFPDSKWDASWITHPLEDTDRLPVFAKTFRIDKEIRQARAYVSGLGYFEMTINGQKTTDKVLEPGESQYEKTVYYATYDLTRLLQIGDNTVGMMLGKGLYHLPETPGRYQKLIRSSGRLQMLAQIEVIYTDGTRSMVVSDESWKVAAGPITFSDWYGGEDYDANFQLDGWDQPGYDYTGWSNAVLSDYTLGRLAAQFYPNTKVMEKWKAVSVRKVQSGDEQPVYMVDFGRNFAGVFEIQMSAPKGTSIQFWPSELLTVDGRADQKSTGTPIWDTYVFNGNGVEVWSPKFVYHGFRYLELRGVPDQLVISPQMFTAKLIRACTEETGELKTSNDTLNQIHLLINRSIQANMFNTLTDCPHREKLGWLEVPSILYDAVAFNYDVSAWMNKISNDTIDSQTPEGLVPDISPEFTVFADGFRDDPTWGGACIMVPYQTYLTYGNLMPIKKSYPVMTRYMEYLAGKATDYLLNHGLGDWGAYDTATTVGFTVSCTYYALAKAMKQIAQVLDKKDDADQYDRLAKNIRASLNRVYFHPETGSYDSGTQAANAMALYYGICLPENRQEVLNALVVSVKQADYHLTTGEIALKPLFLGLAENGCNELVYRMTTQDTMPSYGYFIQQGATSLPEFWDMEASQLHCMLGHIESWYFEYLAGIRNTGIGYNTMQISPYLPVDLEYASASVQTVYGRVSSAIGRNTDGSIFMQIEIPTNTCATVMIPTVQVDQITESGIPLADQKDGIVSVETDKNGLSVKIQSGKYLFVYR